jgi:hypothetical protein
VQNDAFVDSSGALSRGMTTADLDADGDVEVIIVNIDSENYIFLNEGAGSFSKALVGDFVTDRSGSRDVAAGDCDGDADVDLFVVNRGSDNRVFLNDGDGIFTRAVSRDFAAPESLSVDIAIADIDGDDDLDVLVANLGTANSLFVNDGDGSLVQTRGGDFVSSGASGGTLVTTGIRVADFDGDGDFDIIASNVNVACCGATTGATHPPLSRVKKHESCRPPAV